MLFFLEFANCFDDPPFVKGQYHAAVGGDSLGDASPAATRREEDGCLRIHEKVIHASASQAADLKTVLESIGGQDRRGRAASFQDCVRADGCAMHEPLHIRCLGSGKVQRHLRALSNPVNKAARGGRNLCRLILTIGWVDRDDICKCAADVDGEQDQCESLLADHQLLAPSVAVNRKHIELIHVVEDLAFQAGWKRGSLR